ncbi:flotillin family protein [Abyssibacter profundi]|uniref:Flotillin n=1 Tax=Abyssibacter profundi TaxID=2182787 RepID=A0A363UKY4_9GAMM|nr:flotillin domain-containing protein [Abyssibacter profundi]PWN56089.1 flotillin [Abyssibacter profundi]
MLTGPLLIAAIILGALVALGLILMRLYKRASKDLAFVRTGFGGEKVIKDGGALVLPVFHEIRHVGMNTLRLEVRRANENALITADRMRVDCSAEFYVRVSPDEASIGVAAQTLAERTTNPQSLKELVEGKFVDALRAVAAGMKMTELHENRTTFVQEVKNSVAEDLAQNGLELESVSLTGLDQTGKEYFNPDNAFDAEGLTQLTRQIEEKKKVRNDIERENQVLIEQKNLETERQSLEIKRDSEYARFAQEQEVEMRRAQTDAMIKAEQAGRKRESEEAEIQAQRDVKVAREQAARDERSAKVAAERDVKIASQDAEIATSLKSQEESAAAAAADAKRAEAVKASEQVLTVQQVASAERAKAVRLVKAREDAEESAIGVTVAAEAEKAAAEDQAEAVRIEARAQADAIRTRAEADEKRLAVEAEGVRLLNDARNILGSELIGLDVKLAMINRLPEIIAEQVKPLQAIDGIKIMDVRGLNGTAGGAAPSGAATPGSGNLANDMVNAALAYRAQSPLLDALVKELGLKDLAQLAQAVPTGEELAEGDEADAGEAPPGQRLETDE